MRDSRHHAIRLAPSTAVARKSGGWVLRFSATRLIVVMLAARSLAIGTAARAELTPESPEVQRLIARGLAYLNDNTDGRLGGKCLIGLCHYKQTGDVQHPRVAEAIQACETVCRRDPSDIRSDIYSTGIAIVFLCEVDAEKYSTEIEKLVTSLRLRQKPHGGFGYPSDNQQYGTTGDTSMTQYAVLGLWTAKQHGFDVSDEVVQKVANWLLRTQDPGGAWGYQGQDPGSFKRVEQKQIRRSLAAAGLGSTYMCAHLLGIGGGGVDRRIEGLPAAFQRVVEAPPKEKRPPENVDPRRVAVAQRDGKRWFAENFAFEKENWVYYYMYAYERYMSFRELVEGRALGRGVAPQAGNAWYEQGVRFLSEQQQSDGSWKDQSGAVDTAFALLFLMRGTQKTIEKTTAATQYEGLLVGGRGLPKHTANLRLENGQLVGKALSASVEEMLAILEDPRNEDYEDALRFPPDMDLSAAAPEERQEHIDRLQRIAARGTADAKVLAIDALARSGQLDVAPTLIDALGDEDRQVVIAARNGLRRLSRKFTGFGLTNNPSRAEIHSAAEKWRAWYRSVAPPDGGIHSK